MESELRLTSATYDQITILVQRPETNTLVTVVASKYECQNGRSFSKLLFEMGAMQSNEEQKKIDGAEKDYHLIDAPNRNNVSALKFMHTGIDILSEYHCCVSLFFCLSHSLNVYVKEKFHLKSVQP